MMLSLRPLPHPRVPRRDLDHVYGSARSACSEHTKGASRRPGRPGCRIVRVAPRSVPLHRVHCDDGPPDRPRAAPESERGGASNLPSFAPPLHVCRRIIRAYNADAPWTDDGQPSYLDASGCPSSAPAGRSHGGVPSWDARGADARRGQRRCLFYRRHHRWSDRITTWTTTAGRTPTTAASTTKI